MWFKGVGMERDKQICIVCGQEFSVEEWDYDLEEWVNIMSRICPECAGIDDEEEWEALIAGQEQS